MADEPKATPADVEAAMESIAKKAYDAGRIAGKSEAIPPEFPNRAIHQMPGGAVGQALYEADLSKLVFRLRGEGVRNVKDHAEVAELRAKHGR